MHSAVALSLLSLGLALPLGAAAKCACGYRDPSTSMLYTDAIFTYFNESGAADQVVFDPTSSPSLSGHSGAGDTGTGNQNWATSQEVAFTENDFAATWRSAVAYNNTYLDPDTTKGLAMAVAPADLEHRISYGAGLVTRRRDILYGSFRTSIVPPAPCQGGTVLQMSATYNTSEHVTTAIYTTDIQANSTLQWSFSARDQASDPVSQSLSALGGTGYGFYEHRFEWLPDQLTFQNNATNATADFYALERKRDHVNLPSTPSPFSFKHWSNGARTGSQGPPVHHQPVANVVYARLFFNSSLPERNTEFEQQCAAAGGADVCDTEDYTLRDSTPFSLAATGTYLPPKVRHHIPLYSIICDAASGGIFVLLLIHALIKRYLKAKRAERAWIAEHGQPEKSLPNGVSVAEAELQETHDREIMTGDNGSGSLASDETKAEIDDAMRKWDDPSYMRGTDSDEESGFSSDSGAEDEDDPLRVNRAKNSLHSFGHGSFAAHGADGSTLPPLSYVAPQYRMTTTRPSSSVHGLMPPAGSSTGHELRAGASSDRGHGQRFGGSSLGHGLDYGSSLGHGQDDHDEEEIVEETGAMQNTRARHSAYGRAKPRRVPDAAAKGGLSRKGSIADIEVSSDEERGVKFAARPHAHASPANSRRTSISSHIHINSIMGDFPGPGSQDGHRWGGGLAGVGAPDSDVGHGNHGDAPIFRRAPSSYISHEGVDHQVRWNARIVPWEPASAEDAQQGGPLAAPKGAERPQTRQSVREDISRWRRFARSFFVGEGAGKATGSGAARVEYLDGLRGFACFLVSFHHFMLMFYPHVTTPSAQAHYHTFENYWRYIFGAVFTNGGLNVGIFFVLSARVIANRYLVRGKLQDLAEATHRRLPRLAVPISAGILLNYFAIEADMYHWVSHLPSRTWSTWAYFNE